MMQLFALGMPLPMQLVSNNKGLDKASRPRSYLMLV